MLPLSARRKLLEFLEEDWSKGDVTGDLIEEKTCTGVFSVKQPCVLAGLEEAAFLFEHEGVEAKALAKDGMHFAKKSEVLRVRGSNKKIIAMARTALDVFGRMSGVATACSEAAGVVGKVSPKTRVALTRKTLPGFGFFDKKAGVLGGADSHRLDLSGMVLLKDYYLKFLPGLRKAIELAKAKSSFSAKIEIEVKNAKEALDAAKGKPDVVMLDNFSIPQAREAISLLRKAGFRGMVEISGGITPENLAEYASLKPDVISMGSLTHSAKAIDFSFKML